MRSETLALLLLASACGGSEPAAMQLPVVSSADRIDPATTDLGYTVTVDRLRVAIADVQFTTDGEVETAGLASRAADWLLGTAHAHPGHAGGGEVIGELIGDRLIEWTDDGRSLGTGTLLAGDYSGSSFLFRRATAADGLAPGDPMLGHAIHLTGSIERDGATWSVEMTFDIDEGTALVGAPFEAELTGDSAPTIALQLATIDPFEGDTIFDGVDYADLDGDGDGAIAIEPGDDAHNLLRRAFSRHDHYLVEARSP